MVGFETLNLALAEAGISVACASVDTIDKAEEVAADVTFPVGYGVTKDLADAIGAWWEDRRGLIRPSEFLLGADNTALASSYCDGPLGRRDAADVVKLANLFTQREKGG